MISAQHSTNNGKHKVTTGAHQMELPSPLISWVNPFPSRVKNRTIFFCNALESHECACCVLSFLYFHWLFPLLARETSPGNRSIYKSTRERVDSKGLYARWRLHLISWLPKKLLSMLIFWIKVRRSHRDLSSQAFPREKIKLEVIHI